MICPKCNQDSLRIQVKVLLDMPGDMTLNVNKKNIASGDVRIMHSNTEWDKYTEYCTNRECCSITFSQRTHETFSFHNLKVSNPPAGSDLYCCEFVDGMGKVYQDHPKFYSRWPLWAKAHALAYYAAELYRLKSLSTQVGPM